jgi:hypothetical protein
VIGTLGMVALLAGPLARLPIDLGAWFLEILARGMCESGTRDGVRIAVRRAKARICSGCDSRPDNCSLHPLAIGAAAAVTRLSNPSGQRARAAPPKRTEPCAARRARTSIRPGTP